MANIDAVKIRMYRQGFGDCFLIQFMEAGNRVSSMLIDCGLKNGDSVPTASLQDVVQNIGVELTPAGKTKPELDFLVITHEHWDHVSGFQSKEKLFDDFVIGQIWMAWTEDPADPVAQQINKRLTKAKKALAIANEKIKAGVSGSQSFYNQFYKGDKMLEMRGSFAEGLGYLLDFSNFAAKASNTQTPSGITITKYDISLGTEEALNHVKSFAENIGGVKYHSPGKVIQDRKKFPGIRMYLLGPPKNAKLNKDLPTKGDEKETYFTLRDSSLDGLVGGLLAAYDTNATEADSGQAFDTVPSLSKQESTLINLYKDSYHSADSDWRTIEEDYLDISGALALQMDDDTNNTSLVLAMEFIESGKVLLFPGDAQVGSWESWHDVSFEIKQGDDTKKVETADLLKRTSFYKVSHHGSHNATLRAKGLELMEAEDIVAFIPEKQGRYRGIPHPPLITRLEQKTKGRVLFSADSKYPADTYKNNKPALLSDEEWSEFKNQLVIDDLFIELTINANN